MVPGLTQALPPPGVPFQAGLFFTESNVFTTPPPENRRAEGWSHAPSVATQQKLLGWALNLGICWECRPEGACRCNNMSLITITSLRTSVTSGGSSTNHTNGTKFCAPDYPDRISPVTPPPPPPPPPPPLDRLWVQRATANHSLSAFG